MSGSCGAVNFVLEWLTEGSKCMRLTMHDIVLTMHGLGVFWADGASGKANGAEVVAVDWNRWL